MEWAVETTHTGILHLLRSWDLRPAAVANAQLCLGVKAGVKCPLMFSRAGVAEEAGLWILPCGAERGLLFVHLSQTWRECWHSPGQPSQDVVVLVMGPPPQAEGDS